MKYLKFNLYAVEFIDDHTEEEVKSILSEKIPSVVDIKMSHNQILKTLGQPIFEVWLYLKERTKTKVVFKVLQFQNNEFQTSSILSEDSLGFIKSESSL
jgi:hypothetical protein